MRTCRLPMLILVLLLSGAGFLFGQDFLLDVNEGEINGIRTMEGVTESGIAVTIIRVDPDMDEELILRIEHLLESFSVIPVNAVRITVKPDQRAELSFQSGSFQWKEYNMDEYLPSGFSIKLNGSADYDADLFINRIIIHLEGFYKNETEFLDTVVRIIDDPGSYLISRDPEYIFNTFMSMMAEDEQIRSENDALKQQLETLEETVRQLKYNDLILENRSLFGGIRMIGRDVVDWVVEEKENNPGLTAEDLSDNYQAESGTKLDTKEVQLILGLYFGEFE